MSQWVSQRQAAELVGVSYAHFGQAVYTGLIAKALEHKPAKLAGFEQAQAHMNAFLRADCERLGEIVRRCGIGLGNACKVLAALEKGPL